MRNWLRPWSARPQRRPLRPKFVYHKPRLEYLEDRTVPALMSLQLGTTSLGLYGDFNLDSGTYTSTQGTNVVVGEYDASTQTVENALEIDDGIVTYVSTNNADGQFQVNGASGSFSLLAYQTGSAPTTTLFSATQQTFTASQLDSADGQALSYTIDADNFDLGLTTLGIADDPNSGQNNAPSVWLQGDLTVPLSGSGDDGGVPATIASSDYLYANSSGFDFSSLTLSVSDDFEYLGVTLAVQGGLTIDFTQSVSQQQVLVYGSLSVQTQTAIANDANFGLNVQATLGSGPSNAGLVIGTAGGSWELQQIDLSLNGGFSFAGFQVEVDDLTMVYQTNPSQFQLSGSVFLDIQNTTFTLTIGDLFVQGGVVQFDNVELTLSNLNLGVFTVTEASLTINGVAGASSGTDVTIDSQATISLPGGWGVSGLFDFKYFAAGFQLQAIGVTITGEVPVGDTDIFITSISGELDGLGTQNWSVSGSIGVAFGQPIPLGDKTVRIVQAVGSFTLDKDELVLDATVAFGGYFENNQLTSVLGILNGNVTLDWGREIYSASVNGSFLDGLFTVEGEFKYTPGSVWFETTATIEVPTGIPIIGGDVIASATFVFEYDYTVGTGIVNTALFAAWLDLPIIGNAGIEYDIVTGDVSFIGSSAIAGILAGAPQQNSYNVYVYQPLTIPAGSDPNTNPGAGASTFNFIVQWVTNGGGDYYITLTMPGPNGSVMTYHDGQLSGDNDTGMDFIPIAGLVAPSGQAITGLQANNAPNVVVTGAYTLTLYTKDDIDPNAIVWTAQAGYHVPNQNGQFTYTQSGSVLTFTQDVAIDSAFVSQSKADLYMDTDNQGYQGVKIATTNTFSGSGGGYTITFTVDLATLAPAAGTYYFYTVLNDGYDNPNTTPYAAQSLTAQPQLTGLLTETGDGRNRPLTGWTVFIDQNGNGVFDPGEPTDITNANGVYDIYSDSEANLTFTSGQSYAVGVVVPATGYQLLAPATTTFTYNGGTSTVDFQVWQETTIDGTVFNGLNDSGVIDLGEPGVGGVSVYLDLNNNGQLDSGEPTTSSLSDGTYEFVGLTPSTTYTVRYVLPDDYLASGGPSSYSVAVGGDPYALYDGNNFAIVQEATISGTVTGNNIFGGQLGTAAPLSGWTIQLLDSTGTVVATTTSDVNGNYEFTGLVPGDYTVQEVVPAGWQQTGPYDTNPGFTGSFTALGDGDGDSVLVAVADFNNDGKLDYAAYLNGTQNIYYFYGNGDGTFGSAQLYSEGMTASAIDMQTGDFNGDGFTDLLVLGTDFWVRVVWGSATGFTSFEVLYSPTGDNFFVYGMAVDNLPGTWDGDGIDDFAVYGQQADILDPFQTVYYYFIDSCSSSHDFAPARLVAGTQNHPFNNSILSPLSDRALAVGDLNNDGNLDLFINFQSVVAPNYVAFIAYGHGDGTFGQQVSGLTLPDLFFQVPANGGPGNGGPVALGDVNGDGILDAVTSDFNNGGTGLTANIYVFQQTSVGTWYGLDGNFASPSSPGLSVNSQFRGRTFAIPRIAIADINGDGLPDITLAENPTDTGFGQTLTYFNQGTTNGIAGFNTNTGSFYFALLAMGAKPDSMALGDFNNDGQVDLAIGTTGVWILLNTSETVANPTITAQPNGNYVVDFANLEFGQAQVPGAVYGDDDGDGQKDAAEKGLAGVTVFLDLNNNGVLDANEPFRVTNADGYYAFAGLTPGLTGRLRVLSGLTPDQGPAVKEGLLVTLGQSSGPVDLAIRQRLLQPLANATVTAGQTLSVSARLAPSLLQPGSHQPGRFVFTLGPGAPAGLTIDPATGELRWTPAANRAAGTYSVTVKVHNTSNPLQADSQTFQITVLTRDQGFVSQLYLGLLGRAVDPVSLGHWTTLLGGGLSRAQVALRIENSTEYRQIVINRLYEQYLGRSAFADPRGLNLWVSALRSGKTVEQVTAAIAGSAEYIRKRTDGSFGSWLNAFYNDVFGHGVGAQGRAAWGRAFQRGLSRQQIAMAIFTAPPLPGKQGNEYQIGLVNSYYTHFLGRSSLSDPAAAQWLRQLQRGVRAEAVLAGILGSVEYFNKKAR